MGETVVQEHFGSIRYSEVDGIPEPWVHVDLPDLPWVVGVRTATIAGAIRIIGVTLEPRLDDEGAPIGDFRSRDLIVSAEALRTLPLRRIQDVVRAHRQEDGMAVIEAMGRVERQPGKPWGDDHYRRVADVYETAVKVGRSPLEAVKTRWTVSRSMASKYIREARERGFLPWPSKPGQQSSAEDVSPLRRQGPR